jgi:hypothetical protein
MLEDMRQGNEIRYVMDPSSREPIIMEASYSGPGIIAFGLLAIFWLVVGFALGAWLA